MNEEISIATTDDIPQLLQLINNAYRGEEAKKGWTHEAELIDGTKRTDAASLKELIEKENAVILTYKLNQNISACVYLENKGNKLYLGMLSVSPQMQAQGIGKKLLRASEEHAKQHNCSVIEMTVISVRKELIAWYQRNGFKDTGKKEPFPGDGKFGNPKQPLEFVYLEKQL